MKWQIPEQSKIPPMPATLITKQELAPTEYITVPVAEFLYLQRLDTLMDVLLLDSTYSSAATVQAVKDTVLALRMARKGDGEE